jgi:hypothetical protein
MQKSRVYRGQEQTGFVSERDAKADEEIGGRQFREESVVMIGELAVKTRNAGSPGERRALMGVLG